MNADHFQLPIGIETIETNKQVRSCIQNSWTIIPMATTTYWQRSEYTHGTNISGGTCGCINAPPCHIWTITCAQYRI